MTQIQWTKPVCQLDSDGLYLGQAEAELDIYARDGSYIMPGGCIDTEPPQLLEGSAARWTGEAWEYLPDYRGRTAYRIVDGQAVEVDTVGALSDNITFDAPPSTWHTWDGLKWAVSKEAAAEQLAQAKEAKLFEINTAAQAFIDNQTGANHIPAFEIHTWSLQAAEAKAWEADKSAETPVLDRIAASRGVDADKLKAAALRKTLAYEQLTAHIAGQRQVLQSKVEAAKIVADLEKIVIVFTAV